MSCVSSNSTGSGGATITNQGNIVNYNPTTLQALIDAHDLTIVGGFTLSNQSWHSYAPALIFPKGSNAPNEEGPIGVAYSYNGAITSPFRYVKNYNYLNNGFSSGGDVVTLDF